MTKRSLFSGKVLGLIAVLGLLGAAAAIAASFPPAADAPPKKRDRAAERRHKVAVIRLQDQGPARRKRRYTGRIVAPRATDLAFPLPGTIADIAARDGQQVPAGHTLATLDRRRLRAERRALIARAAGARARLAAMEAGPRHEQIAAAEARLRELQARAELEALRAGRLEQLQARGRASRQAYDDAAFNLRAAEARRDAAKHQLAELRAGTRPETIAEQKALIDQLTATLQALETQIEDGALKAPFPGTIRRLGPARGATVAAGQPILRLVDPAVLEAHIGLPPDRLPGPADPFRLLHRHRPLPAAIVGPLGELDPRTRALTLVLRLEDARGQPAPRPGETVRLELEEAIAGAGFWVPLTALTRSARGLWSCYELVERDGDLRLARCDVIVAAFEGERALIRGPLEAGARLVAAGLHRLVPGQAVEVLDGQGG